MNTEPLDLVKKQSQLYPKEFQMSVWRNRVEEDAEHPCGVVACIAGHLVINDRGKDTGELNCYNFFEEGCRVLDISKEQGDKLFYLDHWPQEYAHIWQNGNTQIEKCEALRKRIDLFVESAGTK